ncbi:MAG: MFS transporter [Actinobacteria bacterium]|nr:MFS transporter [Actinomycetota bacterium]
MRAWPRGGLWRHPDFLRLWSAQTISQLGSQVTFLALPLAAILVLDASTFEVALVGVFQLLPFLLLALPAGVWIDRLPRRPVLIAADVGRAVVLLSLPVAYWLDALALPHLYVAGFAAGALTVFFDIAYLSYLPALVERSQLMEGNAKLETTRSAAQVGGPGLAGILVGALTAPVAILVDALSYAVSALLLSRIRHPEQTGRRESGPETSMRRELREGLSFVFRQPYLRILVLATGGANFFWNIGGGVLIVYLVRTLDLSPAVLGLVLAVGEIGTVVGAVLSGRIARRFGIGRTIVWAALLTNIGILAVPLAPPSRPEPVLMVGFLLGGLFGNIFNVNQLSLRQSITPERLQGRMNSVVRFMYWGPQPVGMVIGGALGSTVGLRETLWFSACGAALAMVPLALNPIRRLDTIPEPPDHALLSPPAPGATVEPG